MRLLTVVLCCALVGCGESSAQREAREKVAKFKTLVEDCTHRISTSIRIDRIAPNGSVCNQMADNIRRDFEKAPEIINPHYMPIWRGIRDIADNYDELAVLGRKSKHVGPVHEYNETMAKVKDVADKIDKELADIHEHLSQIN